jgi:hypothetical protein
LDATLDPEQIKRWWKECPQANIGLPTGIAHWVMDVDPRNGGDESLEALEAKHGKLPDTRRQRTGGGGYAYFFAMPEQMHIGLLHGTIAPGIDIQGAGGYVVGAPSIHPNGNEYVWDGNFADLADVPLLPAPGWLLKLIAAAEHNGHQVPFEVPDKIPKGRQQDTLVSIAGTLRKRGLGVEEIFTTLQAINRSRCTEPGSEKDIRGIAQRVCKKYPSGQLPNSKQTVEPQILTVNELRKVEAPMGEMLFDGFPMPANGLTLVVAPSKAGKTILGVQIAIAEATGNPLFDNYAVNKPGPVLLIERDDRAGVAGIKQQVMLSGCGDDTPFYSTGESPDGFGPAMQEWLEKEITERKLRMVVIDSYTAIRAARDSRGGDVVKFEAAEVAMLDTLAKCKKCALALIHHVSITGAGRQDWTLAGAGTYAMFGNAEALINIARFPDLDAAPERLVRIRGRRAGDLQLVLRFQKETLNYKHVLEGDAVPDFPLLRQIQAEFGGMPFSIKQLCAVTGLKHTHAYRKINQLRRADAVIKHDQGEYLLAVKL